MRAVLMLLAIAAIVTTTAGAAAAQQPAAKSGKPPAAAKGAPATSVVNLNTATQAQLESLPGVGAKAAERILEYRQKNGPFKKVEEILETSRSCPSLLKLLPVSAHRPIARHREKSQ